MDDLACTVKNARKNCHGGVQSRTSNADGRSIRDIPACWQDYLSRNMASKIPHRAKTPAMFAVYSDYESDWTGEYAYMIGSEVTKADTIPQGLAVSGFPPRHMWSSLQPGLCRTRSLGSGCRSGGRNFPGHIPFDFEQYDARFTHPENKEADVYIAVNEEQLKKMQ